MITGGDRAIRRPTERDEDSLFGERVKLMGKFKVESPGFDCAPSVEDRRKRVFVEELVAESAVKTLDASVLRGLSGIDEVLGDVCERSPFEHLFARELTAVVRLDDRRNPPR